jgi:hypothetical protein
MPYIDLESFQKYTNVFQDNNDLQQSYIDSAADIISGYLGYNPEYKILMDNEPVDILSVDEIPSIIKMTALRIAALLQIESDSNIGITSKSFGEGGSRSFVNTVNYDKYLVMISNYRIIRI